jgi:hypothetical protein
MTELPDDGQPPTPPGLSEVESKRALLGNAQVDLARALRAWHFAWTQYMKASAEYVAAVLRERQ